MRSVSRGVDTEQTTVAGACSDDLVTVGPDDGLDHAVRRVPVVEAGRPVGVVSWATPRWSATPSRPSVTSASPGPTPEAPRPVPELPAPGRALAAGTGMREDRGFARPGCGYPEG